MLFISVEDFFAQAKSMPRLTRDEEKALAVQMSAGDEGARQTLIRSYLPLAASYILRAPQQIRTLHTVYTCIAGVEKSVDSFNFQQHGETFIHHLSWRLRQCITRSIADRI